MPSEIDDSRPKADAASAPLPLIDFYSFHSGSTAISDNKPSSAGKDRQPGATTIELNDPFSFHQGLSALSNALTKPAQPGETNRASDDKAEPGTGTAPTDKGFTPSNKPDNIICVDGQCRPMTQAEIESEAKRRTNPNPSVLDQLIPSPFRFHQNDKTPGGPVGPADLPTVPALPRTDAPATDAPVGPAKPGDKVPEVPPVIPGLPTGKSPIVEAYERKQGARIAGNNPLPPLEPIPNDLRPPSPNDLRPPSPNDLRPPSPGPQPGPNPRPWDAPKPSDLAPWTPPKVDPDVKPADFRPSPSDNTPNPDDARVKHVSNLDDFDKEVLNSKVPVIVDFYAQWCGPCKQLAPNLERTAQDYGGKVKVIKVDAEAARDIASKYGISSYPTMITFKDGQKVDRMTGSRTVAQLHAIADKMLK